MSNLSKETNIVFVGQKPPMNYVLSVITLFSAGNNKVILKARGQSITTAVDAVEITRHRFLTDLKIDNITLGTEEMPPREGENRAMNVSTIEITLTKEEKSNERK
jgi:DNA-binding protein